MRHSTQRFLTTHTGSLPRPDDLIHIMHAKEGGVPVDCAALAARVREAVADVVKLQIGAGIYLVSDGEMSKPSYATYIKDRLIGFGGTGNTFVYQDLAQFPRNVDRVARTARAASARDAAVITVQGSLLRTAIETADPSRLGEATHAVEQVMLTRFGEGPVEGVPRGSLPRRLARHAGLHSQEYHT